MNAVPTPRFDVGAKALAAQLLWLQFNKLREESKKNLLHDEWEQTIISTNHQEERKVRNTHRLLNRSGQNDIANKRDQTRSHDVITSVLRLVAMPCLQKNYEAIHRHKVPQSFLEH